MNDVDSLARFLCQDRSTTEAFLKAFIRTDLGTNWFDPTISFGVLTCVVSCDRRPPVRYAKAAIKAALAMKILRRHRIQALVTATSPLAGINEVTRLRRWFVCWRRWRRELEWQAALLALRKGGKAEARLGF
nr:hypothetical protein Iba_chr03aCG6950 [Ipomoea batatas]